jgi:hypothetical protein
MKRFFILTVAFVFSSVNCAHIITGMLDKGGLLIGKDAFREQIHSVLVLPVYVDSEVVSTYDQRYSGDYRNALVSYLMSKNDIIVSNVKDILTEGTFKLSVITPGYSEIKFKGVKKHEYGLKTIYQSGQKIVWSHNLYYTMDIAAIKELAVKFNADAVFFQYLQVNKQWTHYGWGGSVMRIINDTLFYTGIMYDRNGQIVFTRDSDLMKDDSSPKEKFDMAFNNFSPEKDAPNDFWFGKLFPMEIVYMADNNRYMSRPKTIDKLPKDFKKYIELQFQRDSKVNYLIDFR